ncbi:MAG: hypothetical protein DWP97_09995 [Calditrichaeota bacterium]|nr:MAG: hypothetical protein DWP97_09995 [Calditrichota bacterium]
MKKTLVLIAVLLFAFSVSFADDAEKAEAKEDAKAETKMEKKEPKELKLADLELQETASGVEYYDVVEGTGKVCKIGDKVECHYTLWITDENGERGEKIQSSKDPNPQTGKSSTFLCTLGQGLIQGWSDGMSGMKEGGTRLLRIPPAIGTKQLGPRFPQDKDIIFEIDFVTYIEK